MRSIVLAAIVTAGMSLFGLSAASAAPASGQATISQLAGQSSQVIQVAGGCGRGWHRGPHGHCRRN
jgi:Spy/CpxP family protein refolding chaperone